MAHSGSSSAAACLRRGLVISTALHAGLLGLLVAEAAWRLFVPIRLTLPDQVVLHVRTGAPGEREEIDALSEPRDEPVDVVAQPLETVSIAAHEEDMHPEQIMAARVAKRVQAAAEEAQQANPDDQLKRLEQAAKELEQISSEKSVDEMAEKFHDWFGMKRRAQRPAAEPVAGEFDFGTAQLHDVRRESNGEGVYTYIAVLVDAEGRRFESRMDAIEGESAYKTMQLMKSSPLAEMVYRRIVMGFLDNIIHAGQQNQAATVEGEGTTDPGKSPTEEVPPDAPVPAAGNSP